MTHRQIQQRTGILAAASILLAAVGCAAPPSADIARASQGSGAPQDRPAALVAMDQRVARVAQPLLAANVALCPVVRQSAGWALHSANQYSDQLRPFALERYGLNGDLPGILAAPEGSPAAESGLVQGDLILSVNATPLATGDPGARPEFAGLAANVQVIDLALSKGPVRLAVRRAGKDIVVTVTPRRACGYEVQLNPSDELNARADGRRLYISTALTAFAMNDDELAVILGHELAHHVLHHRSWNETGGAGRTVTETSSREVGRDHRERQADRVGLYLAARAGFDTAVAAPFWRRFGASNWRVRYPQLRHDSAGARASALEATQAEIDALRNRGEPLIF